METTNLLLLTPTKNRMHCSTVNSVKIPDQMYQFSIRRSSLGCTLSYFYWQAAWGGQQSVRYHYNPFLWQHFTIWTRKARGEWSYSRVVFQVADEGWKSDRCSLELDEIRSTVYGLYSRKPVSDGKAFLKLKARQLWKLSWSHNNCHSPWVCPSWRRVRSMTHP